jgi:hypothetical protein
MTLRDDILADPACAPAYATKDCVRLAEIRSVGRTKANAREIGSGSIIETIGIPAGNALLDILMSTDPASPYRHVAPLIEQGRLLIGSPLVQATVQSFVPDTLTQAQATALCALGLEPRPYTAQEVAAALFAPNGTPL